MLKLKIPHITFSSEGVKVGEKFEVKGQSGYSQNTVRIWVKESEKDSVSYKVQSADDGAFEFQSNEVSSDGTIAVWAENVFEGGVMSEASPNIHPRREGSSSLSTETRSSRCFQSWCLSRLLSCFLSGLLMRT